GHCVRTAASAEAALAIAQGTERFDVLLTDVRLPGRTGRELAAELRRRFPALKVILATGEGRTQEKADANAETGMISLAKPYDPDDLLGAFQALGFAGKMAAVRR